MLSYFVHGFTSSNVLTPNYVLVLFITSVLATVWAIATVLAYYSTRHSAIFVSFIDMCFVAAFIAGVVELRAITKANCSDFTASDIYLDLGPFGSWGRSWGSEWATNVKKTCSMLKACFAFGIMNCLFFLFTSILALFIHRRHRKDRRHTSTSTHGHRHHHRRSGSHTSRRSQHSHQSGRRQPYV